MANELRVEQLREKVWVLDDESGASIYLIEGTRCALVIDTGISDEMLIPRLRKLTDKPLVLALTHLHVDHMYRSAEFQEVYAPAKDLEAWDPTLKRLYRVGHKLYKKKPHHCDVTRFKPLRGGVSIDLGGMVITALDAAGHTPGSLVFVDDRDEILFAGDAFGSGEICWMWLPGCLCIGDWQKSLQSAIKQLKEYEDYTYMGGHRLQGKPYSDKPHAHTLNLQLVQDMETLCGKMLSGEIKGKRIRMTRFVHARIYAYGAASVIARPCTVKHGKGN